MKALSYANLDYVRLESKMEELNRSGGAMARNWDSRWGTCPTCRGWSCMQCVRAENHLECGFDCPTCEDHRNRPEAPWLPEGWVAEIDVSRLQHAVA